MRNLSGNLGLPAMAVFLSFFLAFTPSAQAKYSGGTGEPNEPYRIATPEDLNDIGNYEEDWDKHFILVNDVNLAEYTGTQFNIIGGWRGTGDPSKKVFTGVFDGNDHKIWNFTWIFTKLFISNIGLFSRIGKGARIKNLGIENVEVNTAGWYIGGLVGENWGGTITDCYSIGSVRGNTSVGGLVGCNCGTIINCYSTGSISGSNSVGGLVGENEKGTIRCCYSTDNITGWYSVGGLVGTNGECVYVCDSSGGCQGMCWDGQIYNCYSTGSITGNRYVGGLAGFNWSGITDACYSTGNVIGNEHVGGLIGYRHLGTITVSFWDIETSGEPNSAGGTPKTTAEMKKMGTFTETGWDFVEIWGIGENQTYPFLLTELAGDSNHDKKVNLTDLAILASHWLEGN